MFPLHDYENGEIKCFLYMIIKMVTMSCFYTNLKSNFVLACFYIILFILTLRAILFWHAIILFYLY